MTITHQDREKVYNPYLLNHPDRIKLNDYFYLDEFVSPEFYKDNVIEGINFYNKFEVKDLFKNLKLSYPLFEAFMYIREHFGKAVVLNNWAYSNNAKVFRYRGTRPKDCKEGAPKSSHKDYLAQDGHVVGVTERALSKHVLDNEKMYYDMGIREMEDGTWSEDGEGWLHLSVRYTGMNRIKVIPFWKPKK